MSRYEGSRDRFPGGRESFGGRGPRLRRGDVRPMLLMALLDGPAHGYEVIRRLEERSGGQWRPSPGSVYPALQLLEEEGTLSGHDDGGKKVYKLTETGRALAEQVAARRPAVPWDTEEGPAGSARGDLRSADPKRLV